VSVTRYKPEQIVTPLRQIEVAIANGKTSPQAGKEAQITR
jgi:putative transposase